MYASTQVTETLRQNGIISTLPGAEVSAKDIRKLQGLQWLNDEVITFYAIMLNLRSIAEDKRLAEGGKARKSGDGGEEALLKTHCFTSFMYAKLSTDGYAGVRRWTRKVRANLSLILASDEISIDSLDD
jgi:sentrin-specific protease 1